MLYTGHWRWKSNHYALIIVIKSNPRPHDIMAHISAGHWLHDACLEGGLVSTPNSHLCDAAAAEPWPASEPGATLLHPLPSFWAAPIQRAGAQMNRRARFQMTSTVTPHLWVWA